MAGKSKTDIPKVKVTATSKEADVPKVKVAAASKEAGGKKLDNKKKPAAKPPVKKTASAASTASNSSTASAVSYASVEANSLSRSFDSLSLSPRVTSRRGARPPDSRLVVSNVLSW